MTTNLENLRLDLDLNSSGKFNYVDLAAYIAIALLKDQSPIRAYTAFKHPFFQELIVAYSHIDRSFPKFTYPAICGNCYNSIENCVSVTVSECVMCAPAKLGSGHHLDYSMHTIARELNANHTYIKAIYALYKFKPAEKKTKENINKLRP